MTTLASGLDYIDLDFLGIPEIIATAILQGSSGVALIDPGPSTTLANLKSALARKGIGIQDVRQVLLTHIHLDHAGATGAIVRENPAIDVFVHERGARHMVDPAKLMSSATRLYGADMERLWGDFLPLPQERIRSLKGEETISAGGRELQVAYTPGHASHHVSYFDPSSRVAFVGDTAGIRRGDRLSVMPPTPPPDIDLEAWRASERGSDPRVGSGHTVPDSFWSVSRGSPPLYRSRRAPRAVEPHGPEAAGGPDARRSAKAPGLRRCCASRAAAPRGGAGGGEVQPRGPARLFLAGALPVLDEKVSRLTPRMLALLAFSRARSLPPPGGSSFKSVS